MPRSGHTHYMEAGSGCPLVLLHGHTLDQRMWEPVVPLLAPHFRLIMPDLALHGQSGRPPEGMTMADEVAALLRALGIGQAAVAGLSMGGGVAVSFALHYPALCAALIPVDAALDGFPFDTWSGPRPHVKVARTHGLAAGLESWLADPLFAPALASPFGYRLRDIVRDYPGAMWLGQAPPIYSTGGRPDAERLDEITAPTLVCVGELDLPDFHAIAEHLATCIPGAGLERFAGAGHLLPAERPEVFAAAVHAFLESVCRE